MEEYRVLRELVESLEKDLVRFLEKGNNSAGTRVTVGTRKVKEAADDLRRVLLTIKKEKRA